MIAVGSLHPLYYPGNPKPYSPLGVMPVKNKRQDPYRG